MKRFILKIYLKYVVGWCKHMCIFCDWKNECDIVSEYLHMKRKKK